ncbi:MAG: ATP-binding protein [Myxococcota bacterium]
MLSLLAAPGIEHAPEQVIEIEGLPQPVLRVAAIYGANASGKSNLVQALAMARALVLEGTRPDLPIAVVPFKLDPRTPRKPSRFEFELWAEGRRWSYGFACTTERIEAEWLFVDAGDGELNVFERSPGEDEQLSIAIGPALDLDAEQRQFWRFVAKGTRDNQLFLAEARERNVEELRSFLALIRDSLSVMAAEDRYDDLVEQLEQRPDLLTFTSELLRDAGTGVAQVEIKSGIRVRKGDRLNLEGRSFEDWMLDQARKRRIVFRHQGTGHSEGNVLRDYDYVHTGKDGIVMEEAEESDGTRRLLDLSPTLFSLMHSPTTVVLDEIDRSLHTLLSRNLIEHFLSSDPTTGGQLIFTTHDTNLLDLELLSYDSIWFVEKDRSSGSSIYPLAEFKPDRTTRPSFERSATPSRR